MATVLVCDDAAMSRETLRRNVALVPGVQRVDVAVSGEEVLDRWPVEQPNLVLMDVRMPLIDGLKCSSMLSQLHPDARIVIVTGGRTTNSMARDVGARAVVEKPFELDQLGAVIHEAAAA